MHPYSENRQSKVEHGRVGHITKGYASGGAPKHKSKGKGNTHVNVIVAGHGGQPPAAPPLAGVGAPVGAPPPPRPVMPAPAMPPAGGGLPPGLPPMGPGGLRKYGGRAYAKGGAVSGPAWTSSMKNREPFVLKTDNNKNDKKDIGRGKPITYKTGGAVEHPVKGAMAPSLPGGAGGGKARLAKARRGIRNGKAI